MHPTDSDQLERIYGVKGAPKPVIDRIEQLSLAMRVVDPGMPLPLAAFVEAVADFDPKYSPNLPANTPDAPQAERPRRGRPRKEPVEELQPTG